MPVAPLDGIYGLMASCVAGSTNAGLTLSARKVGFDSDSVPRSFSVLPFTLAKIGENRPGLWVAPSPDTWMNRKGWFDGLIVENALAAARV